MRLNKERRWPSFFSKLLICGFQLHFASVVTPRYLNDCTRSICVPFGCNSKSSNKDSILLLPASINLVFLTFIVNLLSVYQLLISVNSRSRAIWSSWRVDASQKRTASSAYKIIRVSLTAFGRLLMYTLNSKGPKMLPCGTPSVMVCGSDNSPFIKTLCCLWARYDLNHLKDLSDSPKSCDMQERLS